MGMDVSAAPRLFLLILFTIFVRAVKADDASHHYVSGSEVIIWSNKIGPLHNSHETYSLYSIPFQRPVSEYSKYPTLGEALVGHQVVSSPFETRFLQPIQNQMILQASLSEWRNVFVEYAQRDFVYHFTCDGLPAWGLIGDVDPLTLESSVYTHLRFRVGYNGDQIVEFNLTVSDRQEISSLEEVQIFYSVEYIESPVQFSEREEIHRNEEYYEHQVHWFSLGNSLMMVVFLCGLAAIVVFRALRKDMNSMEELHLSPAEEDLIDESNWKKVRKDVFRTPLRMPWLSALYGIGFQITVLLVILLLLGLVVSRIYASTGSIVSGLIFGYAFTSFLGGYASGSLFARYPTLHDSMRSSRIMILVATLFPGAAFMVIMFNSFLSFSYGSLSSLAFSQLLQLVFLWLIVSLPLSVVGFVFGKYRNSGYRHPILPSPAPGEIIRGVWYLRPRTLIAISGLVPFTVVFVELHYIVSSLWSYQMYSFFSIAGIVFVMLAIVLSSTSVVISYFQLNNRDYRWMWTSFLGGASIGFYLFLYCIYYFYMRTNMHGVLQFSYFFGYMGVFCFAVSLCCGAISFIASNIFVHAMYANVKGD